MEYTSGPGSWSGALRRVVAGLRLRRGAQRRPGWSVLVPTVALLAGLLFTTSARTADGTDLRNDRRPRLANLIEDRQRDVDAAETRAARLRQQVDGLTSGGAEWDADVAGQRRDARSQELAAGLTALRGPGLSVRLDDAPRRPDGVKPPNARPDDLVVHQQDVQAVVNALWAGGAEAIAIMDVRLISTSAVRCVGNTLLLEGRVYSPPFTITAIGAPNELHDALGAAPGVRAFAKAAADYGLGYQVRVLSDVTVAAYDGSLALRAARTGAS